MNMKPQCKYGAKCYRKNPDHFEQFEHPDSVTRLSSANNATPSTSTGTLKRPAVDESSDQTEQSSKVAKTVPISTSGFFMVKVRGIESAWNNDTLSLRDILNLDVNKFEQSAQFNYMIDPVWFSEQIPSQTRDKPILFVSGEGGAHSDFKLAAQKMFQAATVRTAALPIPFGTHHTKMMLLHYSDGVRVVIHTANLVEQDWDQKSQGVYVSPLCRFTEQANCKDSPTKFRRDLIEYLAAYRLHELDEWIKRMNECDFSDCDVYLIASVPGRHVRMKEQWGHMKLRRILQSPCITADSKDRIVGQFSSIGSLGPSPDKWLTGEFLDSLSSTKSDGVLASKPRLSLIYPCVEDVRTSLEGYMAGASLPYASRTASQQGWLRDFLNKWKADRTGRSRASPHIKSYVRYSSTTARWYLLTSANLSKAAWGVLEKNKQQLAIRSYELGVLRVGDLPLKDLPLPFDIPLQPYGSEDQPWIVDKVYDAAPDSHGNMWKPC